MNPFRFALFRNTYKQPGDSSPDARGSIFIPAAVVQELAAAMQQQQGMELDYTKQHWGFKLDVGAWKGNEPTAQAPVQPIINGSVSTLQQTQQRAAERAAKAQQQPAAAGGIWGTQPQPVQAPQVPQAPPSLPCLRLPPSLHRLLPRRRLRPRSSPLRPLHRQLLAGGKSLLRSDHQALRGLFSCPEIFGKT